VNLLDYSGHLQGDVFTKDILQRTTLSEQRRVRVFGNRVLRRIFGRKGDGVTGDMGRPYNEELYHSGDQIEMN